MAKKTNFYPVILAGGRGTRFWPLSRKRKAKQLLALDGKQTMIQQTVARLLPLSEPKNVWIVTNNDLRDAICKQLPKVPTKQVLAEPIGRNTAPAIGLAAFLLQRLQSDAVLGLFPSDHVVGDEGRYREVIEQGVKLASAGDNIVVLGIRPTRAETGYGYIESGAPAEAGFCVYVASRRSRMQSALPNSSRRDVTSGKRNVFVASKHIGERAERASTQNREITGRNCCEFWNAEVRD